jgi:Leucine-rich repeat (LRR) protein
MTQQQHHDRDLVIALGQRLGVDPQKLLGQLDDRGHVVELRLSRLGLSLFPEEIAHFTHLQKLYLNANELTEVPPTIGRLTELRLLGLRENRLSTLPAELAHCQALRLLDLGQNSFTHLPVAILAKLPHLGLLDISGNPVARGELPAEATLLPCTIKR